MTRFLLFFAFLSPLFVSAQTSKPAPLTTMSLLEGHWRGTYNGGPIEAFWTAPEADNIMGFIRMMKDGKINLYELFAFEQTDAGPLAMVKHFKAGLIGWEEKDKSDRYRFLEAKEKEVHFEKEDGSIRIIYEKRTADQLAIRRGEKKTGDWVFTDLFVFNRIR